MRKIKLKLLILLLFPASKLLNYLYTLNPDRWEQSYSLGINKTFIQALSNFFGLFPFSVFEIGIYIIVLGLIGYCMYLVIATIKQKGHRLKTLCNGLLSLLCALSLGTFIFTSFWGLNYNRLHFSQKYGLVVGEYTPEQLGDLYSYLLDQAARIRKSLPEDPSGNVVLLGSTTNLFNRADLGFQVAGVAYPSLAGNYGIAKPILASKPLTYTGITGIYSPFTGEPNVNVNVPTITLPSTTCHELAHQRGYGFESECNFIAYLTCMSHPDADFQYSGLIMAISYTSNALARVDLERLKDLNTNMDPGVYRDLAAISTFWDDYTCEIRNVSEKVNDAYLKSNGVEAGTKSYGEVVDLILALYDEYY